VFSINESRDTLNTELFFHHLRDKNPVIIFDHDLGGGTTAYRKRLIAEHLTEGRMVLLVLSKDNVQQKAIQLICYQGIEICESEYVEFKEVFHLLNQLTPKSIFINSVVTYRPFLKHLVALNNYLVRQSNITIRAAIHDFHAVCPSFNLLNYNDMFCNVPNESTCVKCRPRHQSGCLRDPDVIHWRKAWETTFSLCLEIIAFSHSSKSIVLKAFPKLEEKITVQEHSMSYFKPSYVFKPQSKTMRIGILGHITTPKGANVVDKLSGYLSLQTPQVDIYIFGRYTGSPRENIHVLGEYHIETLPKEIEQQEITVFLMPSICPETFSFTTHEIIAMQYPIVAFNLGAQAESVSNYERGLVIALNTPTDELYNALRTMSA
jgi:glycosyltransferase involved in cell wall biosynthesis